MSEEWRVPKKKTEQSSKPSSEYTAKDWLLQMKLADRRGEKWEKRCTKIIRRYRNQHVDDINGNGLNQRGMNVLWSNVETLQPSIYGREPVPIAERRFLDRDVTGRVASQLLERSMRYEMGDCGFHDTVEQAVKDYLLVGRGVAWLRFRPIIGKETSLTDRGDDDLNGELGEPDATAIDPDVEREDRDGEEQTEAEDSPQEKLLSAGIDVDYVHWSDFLTSKARFWKENEWVARRLYLSKDDMAGEFGDDIAKKASYEMAPDQEELKSAGHTIDQAPDSMLKAIVFEIWHKPTRKVYTVSKDFDEYLEEPRKDPLNLEGFWPCPKPLFATMTNDTLEPVPDYLEYQDQALQIDELTNRMSLLTKALKVAGVYDASNKGLERLLDEGNENKLIPVPNWSQVAAKGGLTQAISWLPIQEVASVLMGLTQARDKVKQDMFEITGLSDIIRGQSDPRETAAAVNTKGRWGSLRLQARQMAVARFCRDIIRMIGEIIAEHYPPELIVTTSGAMYDDGIGDPAPEKPPKPDLPPIGAMPPPGIGHNGGPPLGPTPSPGIVGPNEIRTPMPPMGQPVGAGILAARPPIAGPVGPQPASVPGSPFTVQPHPGIQVASPAQGLLPQHPGMPIGAPGNAMGAPSSPPGAMAQPGMANGAPAPIPPQIQYAMAMQRWQMQMAQHMQEKQALVMKAIGLLKQDKMRGFRIDIETDSTIQTDAAEEKQSRTEFIKATTGFVEQAFQIGMQNPDAAPMLGKLLLFGVRGFRAGRDLESTIEEFVDKMEADAAAKKGMPPPPNPELQAKQLELQMAQAKSQAEVQKAQTDASASAADNQRDMAAKAADAQNEQTQNAMQMEEMRQKSAYEAQSNAMKLRELEMKLEMTARTHAQTMEQTNTDHAQTMAQMNAAHVQRMGELGAKIDNPEGPPMEGAAKAPDGKWYVKHNVTGQYYRVDKKKAA